MADIVAVLLQNVLTGNGTKKNPYALILTIAKKTFVANLQLQYRNGD